MRTHVKQGKAFTDCAIASLMGLVIVTCAAPRASEAADPYEITRQGIDGGGGTSTGGGYTMKWTIGQPEAALINGGAYALTGGFWFGEPTGDCDASGTVDLIDYLAVSDCLLGPGVTLPDVGCACFDADADGDIDLFDFAAFTVTLDVH